LRKTLRRHRGDRGSAIGCRSNARRRKVHSLIDKVYDPANLAEAWKRVRENKGSAGIDGLTVAGFEQRQDELLDTLHKQLREKTYRHMAMRKVWREIQEGNFWILDADLRAYFDSIDQSRLVDLICEQISDGRVLQLICNSLTLI
jgi:retron-type reverse transcriptase